MDKAKTLRAWNDFKKHSSKIDLCNRFMSLNFEFHLNPEFHEEDLENMIEAVENSLNAIQIIEGELQK